MVIATSAALLGAAAITAGGSALASSKSSKATKKAAATAAQTAAQNNALQLQVRNENNALLAPFVQSGTAAGERINALLGLGGDAGAAQSAFDAYRGSTGYDFRLDEGNRQINQGYAARGLLESGAAQKALLKYGQNTASDEFGRYMGYLGNQQGVGLTGASAVAGVGQGYANNVSANNNAAGSAAANAALINGSLQSNALAGIGNAFGQAVGGLGSSYGNALMPVQNSAQIASTFAPTMNPWANQGSLFG